MCATLGAIHLPPVTVVVHGAGDLDVTGNVGTSDKRRKLSLSDVVVLLSGVKTVPEAALHNSSELLVDSLGGPVDALGVLGHLESRDSDSSTVGSLGRSVPESLSLAGNTVSLVDINGLLGRSHVGSLGEELGTSGDKVLGLLLGNLVLGGGRKNNVDLSEVRPGALSLEVLEAGGEGGVLSGVKLGKVSTLELDVGDELDVGLRESLLTSGDESSLRVGKRDDLSSELDNLKSGVLSDVSGSRDGNTLSGERLLSSRGVGDHVGDVVDKSVSSGLRTDQRSSPRSSLSGDDTLPLVAVSLVGSEHVSDLTSSDTDITGRNVSELSDVLGKLAHESVAETTDLVVRLSLGVEVRSSLSSSHVHYDESVY